MNVVVSNFFEMIMRIPILQRTLSAFPVGHCEIICPNNHPIEIPHATEVVRHYIYQVHRGEYVVDWHQLVPLDEPLIMAMRDCEAVFLKMAERPELEIKHLSYREKRSIYMRHLRYWNHILQYRQIQLFLVAGVPHSGHNYVIYSLCKYHQIPVVMTGLSPVPGTLFVIDDWREPGREVQQRYRELVEQTEASGTESADVVLSPRFQRYFEFQTASSTDPVPYYMKSAPSELSTLLRAGLLSWHNDYRQALRGLVDRHMWVRLMRAAVTRMVKKPRQKRNRRALHRIYDPKTSEPDLTQPYIYIPLHYQPELTTLPLAGAFVDQWLMVHMLASAVPEGVLLYVKEHAMQTIGERDEMFYQDLLSVPQVRLMPRTYNSFRLLDNAIAIATATGTAGWEGLFRGKPYLMFGNYLYQYAPGVFPVKTLDECRSALGQIMRQEGLPTIPQLRLFLKAIEDAAVVGDINFGIRHVSGLTEQESIRNISTALVAHIRQVNHR
jgi:hypothetical protein